MMVKKLKIMRKIILKKKLISSWMRKKSWMEQIQQKIDVTLTRDHTQQPRVNRNKRFE